MAGEQLAGVEGEERAEPADRQLDAEGHGQLLVLEPAGEHGDLGDDERLGSGPEDEPAEEDERGSLWACQTMIAPAKTSIGKQEARAARPQLVDEHPAEQDGQDGGDAVQR